MLPYPRPLPFPGPGPYPMPLGAPGLAGPGVMPYPGGPGPGMMPYPGMGPGGAGAPGNYYTPYNNPLKLSTLTSVEWFVQYGLKEAPKTSYEHALREVAAMAYLYGRGYPQQQAHQMVESWEVGEKFFPGDRYDSHQY